MIEAVWLRRLTPYRSGYDGVTNETRVWFLALRKHVSPIQAILENGSQQERQRERLRSKLRDTQIMRYITRYV